MRIHNTCKKKSDSSDVFPKTDLTDLYYHTTFNLSQSLLCLREWIKTTTVFKHPTSKMQRSVIFLTAIVFVSTYGPPQPDYYWREYFGIIPRDAFVAGKDTDGTNIYIGQGYYRNHGLKPGRIIPGVQQMAVPWGNNNKISIYNKILCGPQENFYWMSANATHLYLQVANKHAVIGGHDDSHSYLNIGKTTAGGSVKIGKVASFWHGDARLFYIDGQLEKSVNSYDILMYNITEDFEFDVRSAK